RTNGLGVFSTSIAGDDGARVLASTSAAANIPSRVFVPPSIAGDDGHRGLASTAIAGDDGARVFASTAIAGDIPSRVFAASISGRDGIRLYAPDGARVAAGENGCSACRRSAREPNRAVGSTLSARSTIAS